MTSTQQTPHKDVGSYKIQNTPHAMDVAELIMWYAAEGHAATLDPERATAWATATFPIELLWTFNVFPHHPENKAVEAALFKKSGELIEHAESMGYSRDICSYCKTSVAACDLKLGSDACGIPTPDIICCTNTICDTHWKWFQFQSHRLNVPYFLFDIPHGVSGTDEATKKSYEDYIVKQMYDFFGVMERVSGQAFDEARFFEIIEKSDRLSALWQEIFEYRKRTPAPYSIIDALLGLFPLVMLNGLDMGITFYEKILQDVKDRADAGQGVLPKELEKYRIAWEGIPFWHRTKFYYELAKYGVVVAYEPYTFSFAPRKTLGLGVDETLREMARIMMDIPYCYNLETRMDYFEKTVRDYRLDGVILHENMSCRPSAAGMIDLKKAIQDRCGIPVLILQGDQADPRAYSDAQVKTRIETFVELMNQSKKQKLGEDR